MVAICELKLDDVAHGGLDNVGGEGYLWAADNNGDELVGTAEGVGCEEVNIDGGGDEKGRCTFDAG